MSKTHDSYYVPSPSHWPLVASIGLLVTLSGAAQWMHHDWYGPHVFFLGQCILLFMMFGWFGEVIWENERGYFNLQVDKSFRWGMTWFIFSEVCFFGAFFGALFFSRYWTVPLMGGEMHPITHLIAWPDFKAAWPLLINPNNHTFVGADKGMHAWGVAAVNTLILLTSGATITWAHHALQKNHRKHLMIGLTLTILLGLWFLCMQVYEYHDAYTEMNLTLNAGIYGATFFLLTGFHGAHVTIGTIMLMVIWYRCYKGHFTPERHFGFEGVEWYWHFVDVVWLFLFIFVYWL